MNARVLSEEFEKKVHAAVEVLPEGLNRFRVQAPFYFDDGDGYVIVLRREGENWVVGDEGHTYMRLTYDLNASDLTRGTRAEIITNALSMYGVQEHDGELRVVVSPDQLADAFFSFVQCIARVTDVTLLSRERIKSAFMEDFRALMERKVPESRRQFEWHHPEQDKEGHYPVDCYLNQRAKPLFVFALPSDDKVQTATIVLHQFERWQYEHETLGIFEDQEKVNRKVLARFSDVCDKQYSSLAGNRDRVEKYLDEALIG
jgi:hypothetical protein